MHRSPSHNSIYSILVYCHCASLFFTHLNIFYIGILPLCITLLHITQYILYWYICHCTSLSFAQLNIFYIGIFAIVHHSSSHNSIYSILVYCHCASLSFAQLNIFYTGILSLCITLLHKTQYILYWYTAIVHHSSSHNSIYSILVYCHCAPLFFTQLNIFYIGILSLCTTLLHTTQCIQNWYICHCAPHFFTQINIFYIGILPLCATLLHTTQYILYWYTAIVHHSSSHK